MDAILAGLIDGAALAAHLVDSEAEQYCVTNDQALWTFYRDWFEESLAKIKEDCPK